MQVIDDGVRVDSLISVVKESVRRGGVSKVSGRGDLQVSSVQLTLRVMATRTVGGGLNLRVPVIGAEVRVGAKVTTQDTHTIDISSSRPNWHRPVRSGARCRERAGGRHRHYPRDGGQRRGGDDPWVLSEEQRGYFVVVTKTGSISLGAEGQLTGEVTHRLCLDLAPPGAAQPSSG